MKDFFPHYRNDRLISLGRLALALLFSLAVLSDSLETIHPRTTAAVLICYIVYAIPVAFLSWRQTILTEKFRLFSHGVDLAFFAALLFVTEEPSELFFVYFVFLLVCATLRWRWRGTLWTAFAILASLVALE